MNKDQYILEKMQGYTIDRGLAYYLHDEDSDPPLEGQPVLSMCDIEILFSKRYVAEIANTRAGTRNEYDMFEVTDMCKQLSEYGWIYYSMQVGIFQKAKEFSIIIDDHLGNDVSDNEKYWNYDPEWDQNERYFEELEEIKDLEVLDKKGSLQVTI